MVEMEERCRRQRGRLDRHPHQAQVLRLDDQGRHGEEEEQAGNEDAVRSARAQRQISRRVERAGEEQDARQRQHQPSEIVELEPARDPAHFRAAESDDGQRQVRSRADRQQPRPPSLRGQRCRGGGEGERHQDQGKRHCHSFSELRRVVSMEENSRLMCSMMIPITKMATTRSSRTPISTKKGIASTSARPITKTPFSSAR